MKQFGAYKISTGTMNPNSEATIMANGYASVQLQQEAQLPQRNSASAAHMEGGWG